MMNASRPHWIPPPGGLLAGHLAHGLSWMLLIALANRENIVADLPAFAWVHTESALLCWSPRSGTVRPVCLLGAERSCSPR